jgi:hypothetical protein
MLDQHAFDSNGNRHCPEKSLDWSLRSVHNRRRRSMSTISAWSRSETRRLIVKHQTRWSCLKNSQSRRVVFRPRQDHRKGAMDRIDGWCGTRPLIDNSTRNLNLWKAASFVPGCDEAVSSLRKENHAEIAQSFALQLSKSHFAKKSEYIQTAIMRARKG